MISSAKLISVHEMKNVNILRVTHHYCTLWDSLANILTLEKIVFPLSRNNYSYFLTQYPSFPVSLGFIEDLKYLSILRFLSFRLVNEHVKSWSSCVNLILWRTLFWSIYSMCDSNCSKATNKFEINLQWSSIMFLDTYTHNSSNKPCKDKIYFIQPYT